MSVKKVFIVGGAIQYTGQSGITQTFADTQKLCQYLSNMQLNADTIKVYNGASLVLTIHSVDYHARKPGINS